MPDAKGLRVERLACQRGERAFLWPIQAVPDDGTADARHMHADLMRAPSLKGTLDISIAPEAP